MARGRKTQIRLDRNARRRPTQGPPFGSLGGCGREQTTPELGHPGFRMKRAHMGGFWIRDQPTALDRRVHDDDLDHSTSDGERDRLTCDGQEWKGSVCCGRRTLGRNGSVEVVSSLGLNASQAPPTR